MKTNQHRRAAILKYLHIWQLARENRHWQWPMESYMDHQKLVETTKTFALFSRSVPKISVVPLPLNPPRTLLRIDRENSQCTCAFPMLTAAKGVFQHTPASMYMLTSGPWLVPGKEVMMWAVQAGTPDHITNVPTNRSIYSHIYIYCTNLQ